MQYLTQRCGACIRVLEQGPSASNRLFREIRITPLRYGGKPGAVAHAGELISVSEKRAQSGLWGGRVKERERWRECRSLNESAVAVSSRAERATRLLSLSLSRTAVGAGC
jgi:hypothetical protein